VNPEYLNKNKTPEDDNTKVLYFEDAIAFFYWFTEEPRVIKF